MGREISVKVTPVYFQMSPQMLAPWDDEKKSLEEVWRKLLALLKSQLTFQHSYKANKTIPLDDSSIASLDLEFKTPVVGGSHGEIEAKPFVRSVLEKLGKANFPSPLFAVVSHNSAHHLSYVLAAFGFEQLARFGHEKDGQKKRRVVLNFDQHDDNALQKQYEKMRCSNWARFLTRDTSLGSPLAQAYVSIGQGRHQPYGVEVTVAGQSKSTRLPPLANSTEKLNMDDLLGKIVKVIDPTTSQWADWAVYITVDRDMMFGSCTPYGDGHYSREVTMAAVKACLSHLKAQKATLAGFDITGLPTGEAADRPSPKPNWTAMPNVTSDSLFAQAVQDICELHAAVEAY